MIKQCRHYLIGGRVQGVYYRASTVKQAQQLGLKGWVRNLDDGRVEAVICGEPEILSQMEEWLWKGPVLAKVTHIDINKYECADYDSFKQR